jgi:hypothetical protein
MTREQYESLSVLSLKSIAKTRGIKGSYAMKKDQLISVMLSMDEEAAKGEGKAAAVGMPEKKTDAPESEAPEKKKAAPSAKRNAAEGHTGKRPVGRPRKQPVVKAEKAAAPEAKTAGKPESREFIQEINEYMVWV